MSEQRSFFNITEPNVYAGMALRSMLMEKGVRVPSSEIGHAQIPSGARKIAELESLPLREIVTLMNKFSNNFIADTLVKTLGREQKGAPGTMEKGLQVIREEATRLGLNEMGFRVVSGSGLTRENRMTANQFVRLLNAAYLDFDVLPELLSSLPIAGRDGTLRSRMKGTTASGRLRAKTGSIDGVSALTGVVQSVNGELLAFAVLMNDRSQSSAALRPWQNFFGQALADFNRAKPLTERPTTIPNVLESEVDASSNRNRPETL
jgi:D-alanyl-D-alanine carboxypeptidase/D-alanyl-D-alanine-endopeptidase (penicillin-binding protein 4)